MLIVLLVACTPAAHEVLNSHVADGTLLKLCNHQAYFTINMLIVVSAWLLGPLRLVPYCNGTSSISIEKKILT
eukprot:1158477-Pelagomonas_calceolata.AAC.5